MSSPDSPPPGLAPPKKSARGAGEEEAAERPEAGLRAELNDLDLAATAILDAMASDPFEQPWEERSAELSRILGTAIEQRRRLELRARPAGGPGTESFLRGFAALARWQLDVDRLDGAERARRLLVHELRNEIAVLHLVVDREECQTVPRCEAPDLLAALERVRSLLAQATRAERGTG